MRTDHLKIGGEFLTRILIMFAPPGHPARRAQYEQVDQVFFAKCLCADDVDLLDFGDFAFVHGEIDRNPVPFQRCHRRRHRHGITSAAQILPLQFLLGTIKLGAVENPPVSQADLTQTFEQLVFFEFLGADEIHLRDRRPLLHRHHQHAAIGFDRHILEKPGAEQGPDGLGGLVVGHGVTNLDRQITEYRSRLNPLYALDPDVLDDERFDCQGRQTKKHQRSTQPT